MQILERNLSFIKKQNATLFDKVNTLSAINKSYEIGSNLAGQYNLFIDGKPVHSITDVDFESQELIDRLPEKTIDTLHFTYGVGLGYLPDKLIEKTLGPVIVYEPDIETLYFVLSAVDFSENFKKERLYFISDFDEMMLVLQRLFKYKSMATLSVLDYYNLYHKDNVNDFSNLLKTRVDMLNHNISFVTKNNFQFFKQTLQNIHKKYNHYLITDYKDAFKNIPAIIASAGPSLAKNIDILKKYQDNALIFCGGTSLNTLVQNEIIPDFLNVIERNNTLVHYDLPCTEKINFIAEPFTESSYFKKDFKRIFYTAALETEDSRWFLETAGEPLVPYETKGTVAYHAIYTAYYLGCNPIILLGQDLAYSDGNCYAKGSAFDGLSCVYDNQTSRFKVVFNDYEKYKNAYFRSAPYVSDDVKNRVINNQLRVLNTNLRSVLGQNGEMLPTDAVYELFLNYIQDFARVYSGKRSFLNSSIGGALIKGFETIPLEQAIELYANKKLDKANLVDTVDYKCSFNTSTVFSNLKKDYSFTKNLLSKLEKALDTVKSLKIELSKINTVNSTSLTLYKKLFQFYLDLKNNCISKSRMGRIIVFRLYMELEYLVRTQENYANISYLMDFADTAETWIVDAQNRIDYILEHLDLSIKEMDEAYESRNSKS